MSKRSKIKRIALLINALQGGGAERIMLTLARHWSEKGIQIDFLLGKLEGPYKDQLSQNYRLFVFEASIKSLLPKLVRYLNKNKPDILISTLQSVNAIAAVAGKLSSSKTKVFLREANAPVHKIIHTNDWKRKFLYGIISRYCYPLADGLISVSEGLKAEMHTFYKIDPQKIVTIYNPAVTAEFFELAKMPVAHPWFEIGLPIIMAAGRMAPQKDYLTLIQAFAVVQKVKPCKLIILGETSSDLIYYERVRQLIDKLHLEDEIDFVGFQKNPFAYLSRADVFVLSSRFEGLPGVLIQALALGCQLVSTDCPYGPSEILDKGKYGKLVPVGDYQAMAQAILESLDQPNDRASKKIRSEAFGIGQADKYLDVFESFLAYV